MIFSYLPIYILLFFGPALAAIAFRVALPRWLHWLLVIICLLFAGAPFLLTVGGLRLAEYSGCQAEAITFTCPEQPWLENWLTWLFFSHWLAIVTVPSGILGIIGLLIALRWRGEGIYRSRRQKVIAGVCGAIARRTGLPVLGVRIVTVILVVILTVFGLLPYLWLWLAFPLEPPAEEAY
jgi:phage shock protein PspC (stress-responsive transcriptional regulator)